MLKTMYVVAEPRSWQFFGGQAEYLRRHGFELHGVSSPGPVLQHYANREAMSVTPIPISRRIAPLRDLVAIARLTLACRRIRPHIVHAHFSKPGLVAMIAATLAGVPVRIYHNHGMALCSASGITRRILWLAEKLSCRLAHQVLYTAPSLRQAAVDSGVCPGHKAQAILSINGLDGLTRFNPGVLAPGTRQTARSAWGIPAHARVIGFCGRILAIKGILDLLEAWRLLRAADPDLHLLLVGEFDNRSPLAPSVHQELRNDPRIHLAGFVDDMPAAYSAMDLLVLPSYHEGLGYVVIEASAMGLPVVATRIPGTVDALLEDVTGTLVDAHRPEQLARAIRHYLASPELRAAHGRAGRRYVLRTFARDRVWGELVAAYRGLLAAQGIASPEPAPEFVAAEHIEAVGASR